MIFKRLVGKSYITQSLFIFGSDRTQLL